MNPSVEFNDIKGIDTNVLDIDYIPGYKLAEEQRRTNENKRISSENQRIENENKRISNESQRIANENNRIAYYNSLQEKVNNGEFVGKDGEKGTDGYTPKKGVDYWTQEDISQMETHCNNYINQQLETINSELASLTEVS